MRKYARSSCSLPRRDDKHDAECFAFDESPETRLVRILEFDVRERGFGNVQHVRGAIERAAHLAGVLADGSACGEARVAWVRMHCLPAHLHCQLHGDLVGHALELVLCTPHECVLDAR